MYRLICTSSLLLSIGAFSAPATPKELPAAEKKAESFKPFTGKVVGNKVRIRAKAELDGHIVRQANKNDLLLVVGEEGDFYAVEPPKDTKAYVFRSYILDQVVEANRVNVRLEPHVDAPIIGQLQAGDRVAGQPCPMNNKWFEITAPKSTHFYISKEFVTKAGGPEYLANRERKKAQLEELLNAAYLSAETECKKPYEEMSPQATIDQFQHVLLTFTEFPEAIEQAKEGLALLKETYLNKKIAYLEQKAGFSESEKEELIAKHRAETRDLMADSGSLDPSLWSRRTRKKDGGSLWDTLEESLYLSWTAFHCGKKIDDFYAEQRANAAVLKGVIEPYSLETKNRPGDYILRGADAPIAYLYSTHIDLEKYAGKTVTITASPRPNNHFAFPAYYVLAVE